LRRVWLVALLVFATPAYAQLTKPQLFKPPCTGGHCLNTTSGSTVTKGPSQTSSQKAACPAGTSYDARKGTCHVGGANLGAITHY
jgi:hypothetical protein